MMNPLPPLGPSQPGYITVIGAGFMGCVIATIYLSHGYRVKLCDLNAQLLDGFAERAAPIAGALVAADEVSTLLGKIEKSTSLDDSAASAFLIHEVVQENLEVKQDDTATTPS